MSELLSDGNVITRRLIQNRPGHTSRLYEDLSDAAEAGNVPAERVAALALLLGDATRVGSPSVDLDELAGRMKLALQIGSDPVIDDGRTPKDYGSGVPGLGERLGPRHIAALLGQIKRGNGDEVLMAVGREGLPVLERLAQQEEARRNSQISRMTGPNPATVLIRSGGRDVSPAPIIQPMSFGEIDTSKFSPQQRFTLAQAAQTIAAGTFSPAEIADRIGMAVQSFEQAARPALDAAAAHAAGQLNSILAAISAGVFGQEMTAEKFEQRQGFSAAGLLGAEAEDEESQLRLLSGQRSGAGQRYQRTHQLVNNLPPGTDIQIEPTVVGPISVHLADARASGDTREVYRGAGSIYARAAGGPVATEVMEIRVTSGQVTYGGIRISSR